MIINSIISATDIMSRSNSGFPVRHIVDVVQDYDDMDTDEFAQKELEWELGESSRMQRRDKFADAFEAYNRKAWAGYEARIKAMFGNVDDVWYDWLASGTLEANAALFDRLEREWLDMQSVSKSRIKVRTLYDIERDPPIEWVENDFLRFHKKGVIQLVGEPKLGKSSFMLAVAKFLSQTAKVLYIASDDHAGLKSRVWALQDKYGGSWDNFAAIYEPIDLAKPENVEEIESLMDEWGAQYLFVDTQKSNSRSAKENDNDDMDALYQNFRRIANKNRSVFIVHHVGKSGGTAGGRGASSQRGSYDTGYELARDGDKLKLHNADQRNGATASDTFWKIIAVTGSRMIEGQRETYEAGVIVQTEGGMSVEEHIIEYIEESESKIATRKEILAAMKEIGISKDAVEKALSRAKADKTLINAGYGKYTTPTPGVEF